MRRREVIALLCGMAGGPLAARAQTRSVGRKIGFLHPRTVAPDFPTLTVLRPVWERLGYIENETFLLRSAESDPRRLPALANELIELGIGVLIAVGPVAVRAASRVGGVPIVAIDLETDPVRTGLAASFHRPGGNVTGLFVDQPSLAGKWIELLREAAPQVERVALVFDPDTTRDQLVAALDAAREKTVEAVVLELRGSDDYEAPFEGLGAIRKTGIVQLGSPGFSVGAVRFAIAAQRRLLPSISFIKPYARAGLLMTYGPNTDLYWPRAVVLADRILKGEKPGDLPIERPDKFELVINLKTAKAIGLDIPSSLLTLADEVIE